MTNIVIIGAGIIGTTTAYQLAKQGAHVTIIDRQDDGQATHAAAGIICPWLAQRRNKAWYHLAKNGARIYPKLIDELKEDGEVNTGYERVGAIRLNTIDKRLQAAHERVLKRKKDAPEIGEITLLDEEETKKMFPLLKDNTYRSIHISGAARVDGQALRQALLSGAIKYGATYIEGDAQLIYKDDIVTGAKVNGKTFEADLVIATTGAWMSELLSLIGIDIDVKPQKAQIIHLHLSESTHSWPVIMPPNNQYILPFDQNRIVIGATHESKAGFDTRVTAGGVHEILTKALEVAPGLHDSTIENIKVGFRPFTPESKPIIGPLPHIKGILIANGLGASGLTTGPYIGIQLAKIALEQTYDIDLSLYNVAQAIPEEL
ncbi:MAG TPA: FAD-dependent oxidoreductase [Virgibacillus sp.]|nr:FAD-dependent oxidoreductase [Virgibacillus sp.]